jgi:ABC-2 type transport system ATP-binding protein
VSDRTRALVTVSAALADAGLVPLDLSVRRPTLDEAFLQLTGTAITPPAPATAGPTVDEVSR